MDLQLVIVKCFFISLFLFSCSSAARIDQCRQNHPGMDVDGAISQAGAPPTNLTNLTSFGAVSGGGACSTCAH
ncbi:MAG TPA: hypothetical protein VI754_01335 [Bacteriovoracaceae bacterium]|nr:hypothetical protein [Bacteriovoracaceae bacterium]